MKNITLVSLLAVLVTASLALVFSSVSSADLLCSIAPCTFLLLTAAGDYRPKARVGRATATTSRFAVAQPAAHPLRLAA
ncbi:MAG: hypothetical protein ABIZ04_23760 [Opitutus sp.]